MNQKLFILLLAVMFFGGLVPFISALPAPAPAPIPAGCPDNPPFCD
ncbi:23444_t:CDS:1, partial [Dentiscutata erythropus]